MCTDKFTPLSILLSELDEVRIFNFEAMLLLKEISIDVYPYLHQADQVFAAVCQQHNLKSYGWILKNFSGDVEKRQG